METKALESVDLILGEEKKETVPFKYDINGVSFVVNVKTAMPVEERFAFIQFVADNCFVNGMDLTCYRDRAFCVAFWQVMTDLPVPTKWNEELEKEVVDVVKIEQAEQTLALLRRCKKDAVLREMIVKLERDVDGALQRAFLKNLFQSNKETK